MRIGGVIAGSIAGSLLFTSSMALASTPDEWAKHYQEVTAACLEASGLQDPQPVGEIVTFADEVGYDALLVRGTYPQPQMHHQAGQVLCLFNRQTRQVSTSDADAMVRSEQRL
jgi:hypothetical protein